MKILPRLCLVLLPALSLASRAEDIRPGLWKISLESRVAAVPGWQPAPFELTQCLSEDDARNPEALLIGADTGSVSGCQFPKKAYSGGHLSFDVSCSGALGLQGHGEMDFSATRLSGTLDVSFTDAAMGGQQTAMHNVLQAAYVGECGGAATPPAAPAR